MTQKGYKSILIKSKDADRLDKRKQLKKTVEEKKPGRGRSYSYFDSFATVVERVLDELEEFEKKA